MNNLSFKHRKLIQQNARGLKIKILWKNYWNKISGILIDTNSENKLNVDIILETGEEQGLSDLEKYHIIQIWQEPSSGEIGYLLEGCVEEFDLSELEEWQLKNIYKDLLYNNNL